LAEKARGGDKDALEALVRAIQNPVYGLAIRMLGDPSAAEDATQEILIKVITRLDTFRGESRLLTWVYAVAANHLRTMRTKGWEHRQESFEQMIERQAQILPDAVPPGVEEVVLTREIRLMCLHGSLICLDRDHRLAFVLGEGLELNSVEAAQVLGITPVTFRKRLSRARERIRTFMLRHCGMVDPRNLCRCNLWCEAAVKAGAVDPEHPTLAGHPAAEGRDEDLEQRLEGLEELERISVLFRSLPSYRAPDTLISQLAEMIQVAPGFDSHTW